MSDVRLEPGDLVGKCDNCGYLLEDDINFNFPCPNTCVYCGTELEATKVSPKEMTGSAENFA